MTTEPDPTQVPKAAPSGYRYAGAWIRLLALIIDGLLMFAVTYVLFLILSGLLLMSYPHAAESLLADMDSTTWQAGLLIYVVGGVLTLAWFGGWQTGVGATPAMLLLKLRVRDRSGQDNPSPRAAVLRNSPWVLASFGNVTGNESVDVMLGVVSFAVFAAIGLSITSNAQYRGFHDRLAGTYVVRPE
jgi:uncharacterized RDD family membrane protein YckC